MTEVKMLGKHGIMGTAFEKTEYYSSGGFCEVEERKHAIKYVYDIVGEPEVEGDLATYNARPSAIYVATWGNKFNDDQVSCTDTDLEDGKFLDVTYFLVKYFMM